jgi:acetyltransferase-like isoleucine patch superfamily enzyme
MPSVRSPLRSLAETVYRSLPPRLQCLWIGLRAGGRVRRGPRSFIHRSVQVLGRSSVFVGRNSVVSQDCWFNVSQRESLTRSIDIADNCFIGRRNFFTSGRAIHVKDYVLTGPDCHFLGATHVADDPMRPIITTGTTTGDTISIGANTFIAAGARVVGHVTIGHGCIVGAGSTVTRDVPPFSVVVGGPATVRKRYSMARRAWVSPSAFTAEDEAALPDEATYIARLAASGEIRMPYLVAGADMGDC